MAVAAGALALAGWCDAAPAVTVHFEDVKRNHQSSEGFLYDRNGELIHQMRVEMRGRRLPWVALSDLSPRVMETIVRAEDKRFFDHAGVDWLALGDAFWDAMRGKPRGASTLSMQVAAMLDAELRLRGGRRTLGQKWDQIQAARELEKSWSKRQILEAYLNLSTFRGEVQGVAAAARSLFRKQPSGLNESEALLLAALLRGPNAKPEMVAKRACGLARMRDTQHACGGIEALALEALTPVPNLTPEVALAPQVARKLLSAKQREAHSTLDAALQAFAGEAARRTLRDLAEQHVADAAVLVADNATGEVLAYVGNAAKHEASRFVDGIEAPRQAGSTLKPFLYELALDRRYLTAASLLEDTPVNLVTAGGLYVPQNYDKSFHGVVSVRTALSSSMNIPAVRTLALMGPEAFVERLRALGFEHVDKEVDYYGYSLALGSAQVTLWELVNAYRTLVNGGRRSPLTLTPGGKPKFERVLDRASSWVIADILSDPLARSLGFGLGTPLSPRFWTAVKTGTSKDMRDNWCVGSSARYTVGVWVGNFDGSAMWDVSGVAGAAPLWLEVMHHLHRGGAPARPSAPPGLEQRTVRFADEVEPARQEWFVAGTAESEMVPKAREERPRIVYPAPGQIIALDPDIPEPLQRVLFQASASAPGARWHLNSQPLGDGAEAEVWEPRVGSHVLSLQAADGSELDRVEFQVRGASKR